MTVAILVTGPLGAGPSDVETEKPMSLILHQGHPDYQAGLHRPDRSGWKPRRFVRFAPLRDADIHHLERAAAGRSVTDEMADFGAVERHRQPNERDRAFERPRPPVAQHSTAVEAEAAGCVDRHQSGMIAAIVPARATKILKK